ncbi:MAG TPA: GldG family protein [bacterium]|nr:GldG family protein [bacterium]
MSKKKLDALIAIALVAGIALFVNILASYAFLRLDLTRGGIYTVSDSTKKILADLPGTVQVKFYLSDELPPRVLPVKRDILDILKEYENYGKGKVELSVLVPEKDPNIEEDAKKAGIEKVNINVIGKNKEEVQAVYLGIALYYQEKSEILPVVMGIKDIEYELTSAILKLTREKKDTIVFLNKEVRLPDDLDPQMRMQLQSQLPPSHSITKDTMAVAEALREQYEVREVQIKEGDPLPDGTTVLVIHEADNLTEWEKYLVDQFVLKGGSLVVLQSGIKFQQGMMGQERRINYGNLLEAWGLKLQGNMVLDLYNFPALIPSGNMRYLQPYPFWIKVGAKQMDAALPGYLRELGTLAFPFSSSIEIEQKEGLSYATVARSSGKSWEQRGAVMAMPDQITQPQESEFKTFDLAVLASGTFPSAFTSGNLPPKADAASFLAKGEKPGRVFLAGTPELILDRNMRMFQSNGIFFINLVDYLTNSSDLAGIRSRDQGYVFIDAEVSDAMKEIIRWVGILLMPLVVVIFGVIRMMMRNRLSGRA